MMGDGDGTCFIWKTPARIRASAPNTPLHVDSARAGGKYRIAEPAWLRLSELGNDAARAQLTSSLVDQRRQGNAEPDVTEHLIKRALAGRRIEVAERAERLLRYIAKCSKHIGHHLAFDMRVESESSLLSGAIAWSESTTPGEVKYLLDYLTKQEWIIEPGSEVYQVTVDGYSRISDLDANSDSTQAFVAMWFHKDMGNIYESGFEPAIEHAGYKPMRIDKKNDIVKIDDEIVAEIRRSRFLVADFTHGDDGARGGVYFEAGFAFGIGIPVIFTCRKGMLEKVHFDTRQYHHTEWESAEDLRYKLKHRILALIGEGPYRIRP